MVRKGQRMSSPAASEDAAAELSPTIEPYAVLSIHRTATQEQIRSAYRKTALRYHPDKSTPDKREESNKKFQEVAFAYAILSDEKRRRRYDTTGNTAESLDAADDDFDWIEFFREQKAAMVNGDLIEKLKREYQGSSEEKDDVLRVYVQYEGDMDAVYEEIMCSNVTFDDERFRSYIKEAIDQNGVPRFANYVRETKEKKKRRLQKAKTEEKEAMELAETLGVGQNLFGKREGGKEGDANEDALKALIQQRQQTRSANFLDQLEAKYGAGAAGGARRKQGKRKVDEPPEELFAKNAKKTRAKR